MAVWRKIKNKGNLYAWCIFIASIVLGGLYIAVLTPVMDGVDTMANQTGVYNTTEGTNTMNTIKTIFRISPVIFIIGIGAAALIYCHRQEYGTR